MFPQQRSNPPAKERRRTKCAHTEIVRQHFLILKRILSTHSHDGSKGAQSTESLWLTALTAPLHLALDDMEHGDNIAKAASEIQKD